MMDSGLGGRHMDDPTLGVLALAGPRCPSPAMAPHPLWSQWIPGSVLSLLPPTPSPSQNLSHSHDLSLSLLFQTYRSRQTLLNSVFPGTDQMLLTRCFLVPGIHLRKETRPPPSRASFTPRGSSGSRSFSSSDEALTPESL